MRAEYPHQPPEPRRSSAAQLQPSIVRAVRRTPFPGHITVASALGGRVVYAWMWYWWVTFCLAMITARDAVTSDTGRFHHLLLVGLIVGLIYFTHRIIWFLSRQTHRSLIIRVPVEPVFRAGVWALPFLGVAAMLAPLLFQ